MIVKKNLTHNILNPLEFIFYLNYPIDRVGHLSSALAYIENIIWNDLDMGIISKYVSEPELTIRGVKNVINF